ncbi:hypothetical protein NQ318_015976 [Aromia moschata]|uniref:DUF4817 domain-containing protein n=1 Tax=Aromia moschata TaxID=1265417 RepID=A0AAV8XG46_9CUCU|nr:hypothetical protein NQ318_015976 [Aromia moschata]
MSYLTESLKIEILMMIGYGDRARIQCEVVRLFRETHPDLPQLNEGTISKIEAQYREMGHVRKVPSKRQAVVDDDTKLNLLLALEENPITPARQLARDGPFFFDDTLNGARYLRLLQHELMPVLCHLFPNPLNPNMTDEVMVSARWAPQFLPLCCHCSSVSWTEFFPVGGLGGEVILSGQW